MVQSAEHRAYYVVSGVAALTALLLTAALLIQAVRHQPNVNSYGVLAASFLNGRLDVPSCPESDCAVVDGKTYIIFPPLPAVVVLPPVALLGADFGGYVFIAIALAAASLALWRAIFASLDTPPRRAFWLLAALAFASPLFSVTIRAGGVWFFAQCVAFFFMTLALWASIVRRNLLLAAAFLGCAFLCRQMALLWFPAILALALWGRNAPPVETAMTWSAMARKTAAAGALLAAFVVVYFAYNAARFGSPLETGYRYLSATQGFMGFRISEIGLFSTSYAVPNLLYLLFQGPHVTFSGRYMTDIAGLDALGTSLIAASPWLLLAVYLKLDRVAAVALAVCAAIAGITLFYHSNGFTQINTQRYALDFLPLLVVLMARSPRAPVYAALPLLVVWGMVINVVAFAIAARYGLAAGA